MRRTLLLLSLATLLLLSTVPVLCDDENKPVATEEAVPQMDRNAVVEEEAVSEKKALPPTPPPPPPPIEDKLSGEADITMVGGIVVAIVLGGVGAYFLLCSGERKPRFKGDAVFLIGPCGGGKTAIFYKLHGNGGKGEDLRSTHTSMIKNEGNVTLKGLEQQVRLVDYPGHLRLRPTLFSQLEDCCSVIFVIDSSTFVKQAKEIAELMLDLMTSPALMKHANRMLVVCNKTDQMPDDLAGIQPRNLVRKRLETEIEALRAARTSGLGDTGNTDRMELEIEGNAFKWTDSPIEAEFIDYSAKADDCSAIAKFVSSCKAG